MNQYSLDGVSLKDPKLRWFSNKETGIRIIPARRDADHRYPGLDGVAFAKESPYDPGAVAIELQVNGVDYADMKKNLEFITGLFTQRNKTMELIDHYDETGNNDRVAHVTLASSSEPKMIAANKSIIGAIFSIPGVFWRSAEVYTGTTIPITNNEQVMDLSMLAGGNAPIDDMVLMIGGGTFSSLYIEDVGSGHGLNILQPIKSGESLIIDPSWEASVIQTSPENNWDYNQGVRVNSQVLPTRGYGTMFRVSPILDAQAESFLYRLKVRGTNVTGRPTISYRARRSYL